MMIRGFFKAEVETAIRLAGFTILIGAFATTFAWGYHHRQQAQAWREQACAYRFAHVARRATFLDGDAGPACGRLQSLGFEVRVSGLPVVPGANDVGRP